MLSWQTYDRDATQVKGKALSSQDKMCLTQFLLALLPPPPMICDEWFRDTDIRRDGSNGQGWPADGRTVHVKAELTVGCERFPR